MNNYIKFMLLGTSLLASSLYAGVDQNNNQIPDTSVNRWIDDEVELIPVDRMGFMKNAVYGLILEANNGLEERQDLVARSFRKHPYLLNFESLYRAIDITKWKNLKERCEKNPDILAMIILNHHGKNISEETQKFIFKTLHEKFIVPILV